MVKCNGRGDVVGRLVTERSKVSELSDTGVVLPSASGCKEPMCKEVLSFKL
ncbi:hypothetical protein [Streptococcus vestibularis]|uniref:hypothetical protein n=1 Tax=Streptococcus vestibularis TaxID=1343 RepID=UPI0015F2C1CB|nr:hypothetical protein [Streptococcus vestibularis]